MFVLMVSVESAFEFLMGFCSRVTAIKHCWVLFSTVDPYHVLHIDLVEALAVKTLPSALNHGKSLRRQSPPHHLHKLLVVYVAIAIQIECVEQHLNVAIRYILNVLLPNSSGELINVECLGVVSVDLLKGFLELCKALDSF